MRTCLSIVGLLLISLGVPVPGLTAEGGRAESRQGVLVKVGFDAPGTHQVQGGGLHERIMRVRS